MTSSTFVTQDFLSGQRSETPLEVKAKSSTLLVERAVKGMLPKNRLGSKLFKNLYVYAGAEHPHATQQPKEVKLQKPRWKSLTPLEEGRPL